MSKYVHIEWRDPNGYYHGGSELSADIPKILNTLRELGVKEVWVEDKLITLGDR